MAVELIVINQNSILGSNNYKTISFATIYSGAYFYTYFYFKLQYMHKFFVLKVSK